MEEAVKLVRLARYALYRIRMEEHDGRNTTAWRNVFHQLIRILRGYLAGEIPPERLVSLWRILSKLVKKYNNLSIWIDNPSISAKIKLRNPSLLKTDGGAGSGNFGHKGRPGKRGGSSPKYGVTNTSERQPGDLLSKHTQPDGNLTPTRNALHREIVKKSLQGVEKPTGQPTYTFLGGGPASGKSTVTKSKDIRFPDEKHAVYVDPDACKGELPEYRKMVKAGDKSAAKYAHEESSSLAKRISNVATERGYNIVLDGTGDGSVKKMRGKIKAAKENGMRVEAVYVTCDLEEAFRRSDARGEKTGRFVPHKQITDIHSKVSQIFPEIAGDFDYVVLYDTNTSAARKIAEGGNGKLEILDKEAYQRFLDKAK